MSNFVILRFPDTRLPEKWMHISPYRYRTRVRPVHEYVLEYVVYRYWSTYTYTRVPEHVYTRVLYTCTHSGSIHSKTYSELQYCNRYLGYCNRSYYQCRVHVYHSISIAKYGIGCTRVRTLAYGYPTSYCSTRTCQAD